MTPFKVKMEIAAWRLRCAKFEIRKAYEAITGDPWNEPVTGIKIGDQESSFVGEGTANIHNLPSGGAVADGFPGA